MPMYHYVCEGCGWTGDRLVSAVERDVQECTSGLPSFSQGQELIDDECANILIREEIPESVTLRPNGGYQVKAVMSDGSRAAGNFGRASPKKKARFM